MASVAFVITVYNKELYLKKVIEALANQIGNFDKEYIFVNDNSTDSSLEIINANKHKLPGHCKVITNKQNEGPSKSVNHGINEASGDFIKFVDGDDLILPNATQALLNAALKNDADVAFGNLETYDPYNKINITKYISPPSPTLEQVIVDPLQRVIRGNFKGISSIANSRGMASQKALTKINGADEKVFVQDYSIALRLAVLAKFVFAAQTIALTASDISVNHISHNSIQEMYDVILSLYNFSNEYPVLAAKNAVLILSRTRKVMAKIARLHHYKWLTKYLSYILSKSLINVSYKKLMNEFELSLKWLDEHFTDKIRRVK